MVEMCCQEEEGTAAPMFWGCVRQIPSQNVLVMNAETLLTVIEFHPNRICSPNRHLVGSLRPPLKAN